MSSLFNYVVYLIVSRPFQLLMLPYQCACWRYTRNSEGSQMWQVTQTEVGGRRRKGGCLDWWCFLYKSWLRVTHEGAWLSCLPMRRGELIPCFACMHSIFKTVKLALPLPLSFSNFALEFSSLAHWAVWCWAANQCWVLSGGLGFFLLGFLWVGFFGGGLCGFFWGVFSVFWGQLSREAQNCKCRNRWSHDEKYLLKHNIIPIAF